MHSGSEGKAISLNASINAEPPKRAPTATQLKACWPTSSCYGLRNFNTGGILLR